jgi:protein TonB
MLALAFATHVIGLVIASLLPSSPVRDIPVRVLSFTIGEVHHSAPPAPTESVPPADRQMLDLPPPPPVMKERTPVRYTRDTTPPPAPAAIEELPPPQRFVREVGQAPVADAADIFSSGEADVERAAPVEEVVTSTTDIRTLYQQQIAAWLHRHVLYPNAAAGATGKAVVRMRVDRAGYVRYYAIEESSGNERLDKAAIESIRRANPVPAAPAGYPQGNLIEFLVPIQFTAPR